MAEMKNAPVGSSFQDFLREEEIADEVNAHAVKRVLALQVEEAMRTQGITKIEMAERMHTSRSQVDRLLDPQNERVQLDTLLRAASAVGRRLKVELV